nr:Na+/H+ antiporter NhaA [Albibacterium bauzanense]
MAADIAFALAIIGMLSKRVPTSLKIFLAALAIVDDLVAIRVLPYSTLENYRLHIRYTQEL